MIGHKTVQQERSFVKAVQLSAKDIGFSEENRRTIAPESFSIAIRGLLQNWRQGTVSVKTRSEVAKSGKKPWKQKGTGRARAGSARSPLWRGGGIIFGPQARTKMLKIPKAMKKHVAGCIVWNFIDKGAVVSLDWQLSQDAPKTREAYAALHNEGLHTQQINLFVAPHDVATAASFANIPSVRIMFFDSANAYDLADSACWVVLKKDMELFKGMVAQWI